MLVKVIIHAWHTCMAHMHGTHAGGDHLHGTHAGGDHLQAALMTSSSKDSYVI